MEKYSLLCEKTTFKMLQIKCFNRKQSKDVLFREKYLFNSLHSHSINIPITPNISCSLNSIELFYYIKSNLPITSLPSVHGMCLFQIDYPLDHVNIIRVKFSALSFVFVYAWHHAILQNKFLSNAYW